jgi:hypothetical protein
MLKTGAAPTEAAVPPPEIAVTAWLGFRLAVADPEV